MSKGILAAVVCVALGMPAWARAQGEQQPVAQSSRADGVRDGAGRGAAIGAGAFAALALAQMNSCKQGCDWQSTTALLVGWSVLGAGAGAAVGLAADYDMHGPASATPYFAAPPSVRFGLGYMNTVPGSAALSGRASSSSASFTVQLSPHVSVHAEYLPVSARFAAAPGAIPSEVLQNVMQSSSRVAGRTYGVESRQVNYILTQLAGFHPSPWGRVRLEVLGGLAVQGEEERAYYDAYQQVGPGRTEAVPGKYYVLGFGSPRIGLVSGVDLEIAVTRGIVFAPSVRHRAMGNSSSFSYGAGAHWRF